MESNENDMVISAFITMLQRVTPELYTIRALNDKLLKDMDYGEIHITEYVKDGKVVRVQVSKTVMGAIVQE
jgi:hypothetical protein